MVMHRAAEDAENQKQKHSGGSQKTGRNRTAKDDKADDCQHRKCEKHSAAQTIAEKPKQQRIEAKADRADAEGIILDVYRPGAALVSNLSLSLIASGNSITLIITALVLFATVSILIAAYSTLKEPGISPVPDYPQDTPNADPFSTFSTAFSLTDREQSVFDQLVNTEKSIQEIADSLFISRRTCQRYITSIYEKVGAKSRMGLYQSYIEWQRKNL